MVEILEYEEKYVEQLSNLITKNLLEVNIKDYGTGEITKMIENFTIENLKNNLAKRTKVFVAVDNNEVVGTAGIDKGWYSDDEYWILTVFVKPEKHGQGIGKMLIKKIEEFATTLPCKKLVIPASITAHGFYYKLGYNYKNNEKKLNEDNMYIMDKFL